MRTPRLCRCTLADARPGLSEPPFASSMNPFIPTPKTLSPLSSPQIPRQLYTTRSERLMSEMVDFHHFIPHNEVRLAYFSAKSLSCVYNDICINILQLYDVCKGKKKEFFTFYFSY